MPRPTDAKRVLVFDSTILVSAFLKPVVSGPSFDLLRLAADGVFELCLSLEILDETERVLRTSIRIRKKYDYSDSAIGLYRKSLSSLSRVIGNPPKIRIVRDPNDDMVLACAIAANADFLVTRDQDLLSLQRYEGVEIVAPEGMLRVLRRGDVEPS